MISRYLLGFAFALVAPSLSLAQASCGQWGAGDLGPADASGARLGMRLGGLDYPISARAPDVRSFDGQAYELVMFKDVKSVPWPATSLLVHAVRCDPGEPVVIGYYIGEPMPMAAMPVETWKGQAQAELAAITNAPVSSSWNDRGGKMWSIQSPRRVAGGAATDYVIQERSCSVFKDRSSDPSKCGLVSKGAWYIRSLLNPLPMKPR